MSNCKVIALTNQKGGVGKTTTAVNLGVSLAQQDVIDDKPANVQKAILHHNEGVDLLPSNIELSGLEVRLINAISRESVLKTCINEVKKNYDVVLVDCMPSLGMLTINALAAADSVVIPTQPHYLSAKGLELLLRSVSKVKRQINPHLRIDGILMTMVMPRTNISKEITATVKSAYGQRIKVFNAQIPHSIRAVAAQSTMWESWRNARMGRSTPWRAILAMPANSRAIQSGAAQSMVTERLFISRKKAKENQRFYSSGSFALHITENKVQIIIPLREQPYSRKHSAFSDDGLESG